MVADFNSFRGFSMSVLKKANVTSFIVGALMSAVGVVVFVPLVQKAVAAARTAANV